MKHSWYQTLLFVVIAVLYFVLIGMWISIPEETMLNVSVSVFTLTLTAIYLILRREHFKAFYLSPQFRRFTNVLVSAGLIFCILGLLNYLSFKRPISKDLSQHEMNSLTDQSLNVLKRIKDKVKLTAFTDATQRGAYAALLELYRLANPQIEVNFIDAEVRPDLVKHYDVQRTGTIVLNYGDKVERVVTARELELTNAIIRLTRDKTPLVLFTKNHGESVLESVEGAGLSHLKQVLSDASFQTGTLNLLSTSQIPAAAELVVIWGPKQDFSDQELKSLQGFWDRGGNIMVALDPDLNKDHVPFLRTALKNWGVEVRNNLVIDLVKHVNGSQGSVPLIENPKSGHPIMKGFEGTLFFPLVSSLHPSETQKAQTKFSSLVETSIFPASWAENNPKEFVSGKVQFHPEQDERGPITLAAALEHKTENNKLHRLIVFGNSTFVNNAYGRFSNNFLLFHNAVAWGTNIDQLISFDLPSMSNEPVFMSSQQLGVIFYASVLFIPLLLLCLAFIFYRRRVRL